MKHEKIYIITIEISIGLIFFSFLPYGWKVWENILVSIGCSGITAAIMAIFLELYDEKKERIRRKQLRQAFLSGLECELRYLFERVLWFDNVLDKINLSKDIEYYLSLDFISEAYSIGYYQQTSFNACEREIEQICRKCQPESLLCKDSEMISKVQKMFSIIGSASKTIIAEFDIIKRNQMFLITNGIFTSEELKTMHTCIGKNVELLSTPNTSYGLPLNFLLEGYKNVHKWGQFEDDTMIISWKNCKNPIELLIEKRKKEATDPIIEQQEKSFKIKKEKYGIGQKMGIMFSYLMKSVRNLSSLHHGRKDTD